MKDERLCPGCGKPALSVATRCPKCGYVFETRYEGPRPEGSRTKALFAALVLLIVLALIASNALRRHGRKPAEGLREAGMEAPRPLSDTQSTPHP